ncbi:hypothetical protein Tco_1492340 [Tanacetum coccineum]
MAGEDEFHNDNPPPPPPVTPTQQAPHTLSAIKLPVLKKGEYDIWAMKMEHYLGHTDYPIWEVIQKGNGLVQVSTYTNGHIRVLPPKTAIEILARERERKARTTLLMFILEDHLAKFYKMTYAKDMWEAIKSRFGVNDESKKMQKYILKQQFESFFVSNSEGLHKGYDRFQSLLSQLEIHGAGVSTEDANQKFLRSLPASWFKDSLYLGSIIDSYLSEVVLGKQFARTSKLTYDESLGLVRFSQKDDEVVFRMPQRKKELDLVSPLEKDKFEAFFMDSLKVRKMGFKHILKKKKRILQSLRKPRT